MHYSTHCRLQFNIIGNSPPKLDLELVRSHFPGLQNGWAYFDNAGGSQILKGVVDRMNEFLFRCNAQTGGTYETSMLAADSVKDGRNAIAELINASRPEEIVFQPSTTSALQLLSRAISASLTEEDEIIVTNSDHESNIGPWTRLLEMGVRIKTWNLNQQTYALDLSDLESLLTERTKLVCVTHVSNIIGTINPIAEITEMAHAAGARVCVDSVAFAPHRRLDVRAMDADFVCFSTYKTFGPHFAVLFGKYDRLLELPGQYHYFHAESDVPRKLEPGNPSYELAYSLTGLTDYLRMLGENSAGTSGDPLTSAFDAIEAHESELAERFLRYLRSRKGVTIVGSKDGKDPGRVPTISFTVDGRDPSEIAQSVEKYGIAIRYGDFYARRLVEDLGLSEKNGVVRVSMVHYNTPDEVDSLVEALEKVL